MNFFQILMFFFTFVISTTTFGASLETVPATKVFNAFNSFSPRVTTQAVKDALEETKNLEAALFYPVDIRAIPDQVVLLNTLRLIRERLNSPGSITTFGPIIKNLRKLVSNRIDLARIDQNVGMGQGVRGTLNHPDFNLNVQNALNSITGVIFHITKSLNGEGAIDESVREVGSGMLVHFALDAAGAPNVQNLEPGMPLGGPQLNGVLTCAHLLTADGGDVIEVYFVPSSELNLLFGLPTALALDGAYPAENTNSLINFLRTSPHSFRITNYSLWQRHHGEDVVPAPRNLMAATNPMYFNDEDMVVATIEGNQVPDVVPLTVAPFRAYDSPASVTFVRRARVAEHMVGAEINSYFAIGYPGCEHYDLDLPPLVDVFNPELTDDFELSPIFVTKALTAVAPVTVDNGRIEHSAPTAAGMSGGPLLTVNGDNIHIFGIITSGTDDNEKACNLE